MGRGKPREDCVCFEFFKRRRFQGGSPFGEIAAKGDPQIGKSDGAVERLAAVGDGVPGWRRVVDGGEPASVSKQSLVSGIGVKRAIAVFGG